MAGNTSATITTLEASEIHYVLGESLRPLLTNDMGSSIEIFDTSGPAGGGPPPHQRRRGGCSTDVAPERGPSTVREFRDGGSGNFVTGKLSE